MSSISDMLWFAWPWIGLGGGIVLLILLLFTDILRSDLNRSRWRDPVWLSWAVTFVYLPHVCEEYGMHIVDGQYAIIKSFQEMGMGEIFGEIPIVFFPLVNITLTWIALPIAAALSKKNPVLGLSGIGFILFNGITHIGGCVATQTGPITSPGAVSGIFIFIPLFVWICCVVARDHILPKKGLRIAIISGMLGHLLLFSCYFVNKLAGGAAMLIYSPFVAFSPLIISLGLCRLLKVKI